MYVEYFVDLQKPFDTIDQKILLSKIVHTESEDITNLQFKSYLSI